MRSGLNREQIITTLRAHESELRSRGVVHAALFGSIARGEEVDSSDIDILLDLAPDAQIGVYEYVGIQHYLADLFAHPVDVANGNRLKPFVRFSAERDAICAF